MATEVPQNEEISGGSMSRGGEEVGSAIRQRILSRGSIIIERRDQVRKSYLVKC